MMRSKNFSFSFAENVSEFMILRRNIREIRSFCKFCGISLNIQRAKTEFEIVIASFPLTTILYGSTYWKYSEEIHFFSYKLQHYNYSSLQQVFYTNYVLCI